MAVTVTTEIACPLFCEGGVGTISSSFMRGTAKVTCCDICKGGSFSVKVSEMDYYLPTATVTTYQHRNGLVTLTGQVAS